MSYFVMLWILHTRRNVKLGAYATTCTFYSRTFIFQYEIWSAKSFLQGFKFLCIRCFYCEDLWVW